MRSTPVIIPIILILCVGTLAYLLLAALGSTGEDQTVRLNQLPERDQYELTDPAPNRNEEPAALEPTETTSKATSSTPAVTTQSPRVASSTQRSATDLDRYYQPVPEEEIIRPKIYQSNSTPRYGQDPGHDGDDYVGNEVVEELRADRNGRYRIQVGSFNQLLNAKSLVKELKAKGLLESQLIETGGPAYVIAGRRASEAEARKLLAEVQKKGYQQARIFEGR